MRTRLLFLFFIPLFISCRSEEDRQRFDRRSYAEGEKLYKIHCIQCHQPEGEGFKSLYPPLAGSDYLMKDVYGSTCVLWNGVDGEIEVNGKKYNQKMLPVEGISLQKTVDILTYISNSWGNKFGTIEIDSVKAKIGNCE